MNLSNSLLRQCRQTSDPAPVRSHGMEAPRLRIAFLSEFLSGHSHEVAFEGLFRFLDRLRYEVSVIYVANSTITSARETLDFICTHFIQPLAVSIESFQALHSPDLDILYFRNIEMSFYQFTLLLFTAAPIQIKEWGIPQTSDIREIGFFMSPAELEPPGSEANYTESLVRLPGGLPCCFSVKELGFIPLPRDYLLLPTGVNLVGCLQSLHKIHPDFDLLLEHIAQRSPEAVFVFVEDPIEARTAAFLDRLSRTAPAVKPRCLMLAQMTRQEYHSLCNCIDLLLDPIHYGSGITFFEASFVGTPIVTLEGQNLRSRVVSCGYTEMEIEDPPIAHSTESFVELATELLQDSDRRHRLKASILTNNHRIFERLDYIQHFERFCLDAVWARRVHG